MKKKKAFSLVEILISLIVVSILLAAFVPVITKKMSKNIEINAVGGSAEGGDNVVNNSAIALNGQTQTIAITDKIKNFRILTLQAAGGGGGGAFLYGAPPRKQADCPQYTKFIPAEYNGEDGVNTCVTQYNIGDAPDWDDSFFEEHKFIIATSTYYNSSTAVPGGYDIQRTVLRTSSSSTGANGDSTYGDTRTIFYWSDMFTDSTELVKKYFELPYTRKTFWRKPYLAEIKGWVDNIYEVSAGQGKNGLQLCTYCYGATPTDSFCCTYKFSAYVYNSSNGFCSVAKMIVEDTLPNPGAYYSTYLCTAHVYKYSTNEYTFVSGCDSSQTGSLRLVTPKIFHDGSRYGGAGGSSGANVLNVTVPQDVIDSYPNGFITIYGGKSGEAGMSAVDFDLPTDGKKGEDSYVLLTDASLNPKWGIMVKGGEGGKAASADGHGQATIRETKNCKKLDSATGYRWLSVSCSSLGAESAFEGQAGAVALTSEEGGYGAQVNTPYDGGAGGNTSNCIGQGGQGHGTGGGGAYLDLSYAFAFDDAKTLCPGGTGGTGYTAVKWGEEKEEQE